MMSCVLLKNGGNGKADLAPCWQHRHRQRVIRNASLLRTVAALFVLLALSVRVVVPTGWMPSSEKAFALTVCTGMDVQTVWLDKQGELHKEDPSKGKAVDHPPCAFDGAPNVGDVPQTITQTAFIGHIQQIGHLPYHLTTVGHGLAAPPPPAIGPPSFI